MGAPVEGRVSQSCLALAGGTADWRQESDPAEPSVAADYGLMEGFVGVGDAPDLR